VPSDFAAVGTSSLPERSGTIDQVDCVIRADAIHAMDRVGRLIAQSRSVTDKSWR
jgi:hypothetical protein